MVETQNESGTKKPGRDSGVWEVHVAIPECSVEYAVIVWEFPTKSLMVEAIERGDIDTQLIKKIRRGCRDVNFKPKPGIAFST